MTKREYEQVAEEGGRLLKERKEAVAGAGDGVTVFNTLGFTRRSLTVLPGGDVYKRQDIRFILENQCIQKAFYRHGMLYYFYIPVLPDFCTLLFYKHMGG